MSVKNSGFVIVQLMYSLLTYFEAWYVSVWYNLIPVYRSSYSASDLGWSCLHTIINFSDLHEFYIELQPGFKYDVWLVGHNDK